MAVQVGVGAGDQILAGVVFLQLGQSHGHRSGFADGGEHGVDAAQPRPGGGGVDALDGAQEFFAAMAADQIVGALGCGEGVGDAAEQPVPGCVTEAVVDLFELIDVDEGGHERVARVPGPGDVPVKLDQARFPGVQPGEHVEAGVLPVLGGGPAIGGRVVAVVGGVQPVTGAGGSVLVGLSPGGRRRMIRPAFHIAVEALVFLTYCGVVALVCGVVSLLAVLISSPSAEVPASPGLILLFRSSPPGR